jgi:nitrite reductase/ring-hydroxylating ferredoxin subunit
MSISIERETTPHGQPERNGGSGTEANGWLRVAPMDELQRRGVIVVRGADRPIAVYAHGPAEAPQVSAVDNRCPHMGFPLHRGTVQNGILTCHWHHARFDLCSGCTFDLFADDVPVYDTEVRGGEVYVASMPRRTDPVEHFRRRLREGMEQNIPLIQAKSIIGLLKAGVDYREIVRQIALFTLKNRDGWASGMTILTALANLFPRLGEETAYLALYQGSRRAAADTAGMTPRRDRYPLEADGIPLARLDEWLTYWTTVRQRDAAERTLLTAVQAGASVAELTELLFSAATERFFADTGHVLDFCNKAFELLDLIGWEHAPAVLPTVVAQLVAARGGEELNAWRYPADLVPALREAAEAIPADLREGEGKRWDGTAELGEALLGEEPLAVIAAIQGAMRAGAKPAQLTQALAYAAALRVARFGTANEFGDWIGVLHTFTYCNALHQAIKRSPAPRLVRGVFHGAMSVYLDRFLNVPPARLPGERDSLDDEPRGGPELLERFLEALNGQQQVDAAARAVARYLQLGHPVQPLFDALAQATVREDADFHTFQMLEAGIRQYEEWGAGPEGNRILIAVARYLAAHSPTQRAQLQTARIALRLNRGEALYEEEETS